MRLAHRTLVANAQLVAPLGPAARQHGSPIGRFHALTKAVSFRTVAIVRLKSTFWHYASFLVVMVWDGTDENACRNGIEDALRLIH
jgi:hypothetical protein